MRHGWVWFQNGGGSGVDGGGLLESQKFVDTTEEVVDIKGLFDEVISAGIAEGLDLSLIDDTGDAEDFDTGERGIGAEARADQVAIDIGEHEIQQDQVRAEGLGLDASVVAGAGGAGFQAGVAAEQVLEEFDDGRIVIDDEDALGAAIFGGLVAEDGTGEDVGGDVVGTHEADEFFAGDAAEL